MIWTTFTLRVHLCPSFIRLHLGLASSVSNLSVKLNPSLGRSLTSTDPFNIFTEICILSTEECLEKIESAEPRGVDAFIQNFPKL